MYNTKKILIPIRSDGHGAGDPISVGRVEVSPSPGLDQDFYFGSLGSGRQEKKSFGAGRH